MGGLWLSAAFPRKGPPQSGRVALGSAASLLVIGVLCAPMVPYLLQGMSRQVGLAAMGRGMDVRPEFFLKMLGSWSSGPGLGLLAFLALFLVGMVVSARSHSNQLWLTVCWMVVPFLALYAVQAKHGVHTRYMIFILPIYLLTVARGLTALWRGARSWLLGGWRRGRSFVAIVAASLLAASSLGRVHSYYGEDRADWRAVASFLGNMVAPGEVIVSPAGLPSVVLPRYHERLEEVEFLRGRSEAFLDSTSRQSAGVWSVAKRGRNMESIGRDLKEESFLVFKVVFPVDRKTAQAAIALDVGPMYYDLAVICVRDGLESQDIVARYHRSLEIVPPKAAAFIHTALGNVRRAEGRVQEAVNHYQEAASLDPDPPEPHCGLALVYEAQGVWEQYIREWQRYQELANASK